MFVTAQFSYQIALSIYFLSLFVYVFQNVTPLQIVYPDTALRLQALLDFEEENAEKRVAGDEWLFEGPGNFLPLLSSPNSNLCWSRIAKRRKHNIVKTSMELLLTLISKIEEK